MALGALAAAGIGAGIQGLMGLGRGIVGGIQSARANKALKNFKFPEYTMPSELENMLSMYQQRAAANELPGQSLMENKLGAQTAFGQRAAEKYAGTSGQALGAVTGLYGQQMNAVRDLGIKFADFKAQRENELGRAQQIMAQAQDKQWEINEWLPSQYKYNELQSQKQAGASNLWGGLQDIASAGMNFMGAKAQMDGMQGMNPWANAGGQGAGYTPNPSVMSYYMPGQNGFAPMGLNQPPIPQSQPLTPYNIYGSNNLLFNQQYPR